MKKGTGKRDKEKKSTYGIITAVVIAVLLMVGAFFLGVIVTQKEQINDGSLVYVFERSEDYDNSFSKRGYYLDEATDGTGAAYVVIASGERNTGGYSIKIDKIDVKNEEVHIYVSETTPDNGDVVTMAFTYPTVGVKFNKMPKKITVTGEYGEVFRQQKH